MTKHVSPKVAAKVAEVDKMRNETNLMVREICDKVGIPPGSYNHAKWKMNGGREGVKQSHLGRPKVTPRTVQIPRDVSFDAALPKLVDDMRRLVKRIDAELAEHDKFVATRARLQAMLNAGAVEERMNDVDQERVARVLGV